MLLVLLEIGWLILTTIALILYEIDRRLSNATIASLKTQRDYALAKLKIKGNK